MEKDGKMGNKMEREGREKPMERKQERKINLLVTFCDRV